ncbi:MAG: hypothetical protein ACRC1M_04060 [Methanobacteriaceae archaeon]
MTTLKKTSIQIPIEMLIEIKTMALKEGTSQNTIINNLIAKGMGKTNENEKIPAKLINDRLPKVKSSKKYGSLKDMAGIIKLDHETDSVKLKNSIYTDKAGF